MKKPSIFLLTMLLVYFVPAQNITSETKVIANNAATTTTTTDLPSFNSSEDAEKIISRIMEVLGLQESFKVKTGNIPNVEADIRHHQRYIIYNPDFVSQV